MLATTPVNHTHTPSTTINMVLSMPATTPVNHTHTPSTTINMVLSMPATTPVNHTHTPSTTINMVLSMLATTPVNHTQTPSTTINMVLSMPATTPVNQTHHLPPSTWCCPCQPQHQSITRTIYHHQHGAVHASHNTSQSHTHSPSTTINMVLSMPASTPVNHTHTHHLPPSTWCCPCQPQHQSITHTLTIYHHQHGAVHASHNTSQSHTPSTTINMVLSMPATTPVNQTHHLPPSTWCCPCQPQHQSITRTIYHHPHGAVHASHNTSQSNTPSTTINMVLSMPATTPVNHTHHLPPSTWCCPCQPQHQSITHTHAPSTTINMVLSMPATTPVNHTHHLPPPTWCCPCQPQHQSITHTHHLPPSTWCCPCQPQHQSITHTRTIYHHQHGAVHASLNTSQSHTHSPSTTINMVLSMPATTPVNHTHHLPPSTWCCPCQPQHQSIKHTIYHHQHGAVHASHNTSQSHAPSTTTHIVLSMPATTPVNQTHHLPPSTWCCPCQPQHQSITRTIYHHQHGAVHASHNTSQSLTHTHHLPPSTWCCPCQPQHQSITRTIYHHQHGAVHASLNTSQSHTHTIYHHQHGAVHASLNTSQSHTHTPSTTINMVLSMPASTPVNHTHTHHLPPSTWCCPCQPQHQSITHTIYHHSHGAVHVSHNTSQSQTPSTTINMVLSMPATTPVNHTHHLPPSTWCCPCQPQHQSITHTIYHHQHGAVHASLNTSQSHTHTPSTTINMVLSIPASTPVNQTHHLPPSTWCCPCQPQHQSITRTIYHHQHGAVHASHNTSQSNTHTPSTTINMVLSMPATTPVNHTHTHHLPPSTWCCPCQPQHQSITHTHTIYHHQHGAVHASLNTSQSHTHTPSTTINMVLSMPATTPVNHTHHLPPFTWCCPCQPQHQSITHTIYHHQHGAVHASHNTSQSHTPSTTINMVLSMPATTPVNHTHTHHLPPSTWCCPYQPQHQSIKHTIYHHQHGAVHASLNTSQSHTASTPVNHTHTHHLPPSTWCCPCQPQHQSITHTHTIYHHQHGAVHASLNTSQSHTPSTTIHMVLSMSATTPVNHTHHLPPSTWCCPCQPQHQSITHTIYHHQHGAVHASLNTSQSHTPSTTINMVLSMSATTPVNHTHHLPPSTWCCPCQPQHQSITHTIYHHQHGAVHVSHNTSQSHTPSTTINMVLSMPATTPVNQTHHLPPSTWCCPCQPQHQSITRTIYHHPHGAVHASHNTSQSNTPSTTINMVLSMPATTPVNHTHHLPPSTWCCPCQPQHQSITHTHAPSTTINMVLSMPATTPVNHTHHLPPPTWCCPCQPQHQSITHTHHLPPSTWCCPCQPQHQSITHTRTIYHHQHGAVHTSLNTSQSHTHSPSTTINMVLSMPATTPVNHTHHLPPSTWCCPCQPQHQSIKHTIYHHQHGAVHASHNTSQSHAPSTTTHIVLSMPATTPVNQTHHLPPSTWCCPCQPQHQSITRTIYHHQHGAVHASHNTSQSHTPSTTTMVPPPTWCCPCQPQHQSITHTHHLPPSTWCCPCQPQHQSITHTHHLPPSTWCCPYQPQHQSITHTIYHHQHGAVHTSLNTSQSHTHTIYHHQHGAVHTSLNTSQSHTHTIYHHQHGAVHTSLNTSQSNTPSTTINMVLSMPASTPVNHTHHLPPSTWCCPCQPQHQSITHTHTIYHHQHGAVHTSLNTSQSNTPSTTINMVLSMPASTPVNHTHHLPPSTWCCPCQPQHQSIKHTHTIYHHQHGAVHASHNTSQSHTHTPSTTINMVLSMPASTPVNHTHTHTIYHHQHGAVHASLNTSQSHTHTPSTTINMVLSMPATTPVNHTHHLPPFTWCCPCQPQHQSITHTIYHHQHGAVHASHNTSQSHTPSTTINMVLSMPATTPVNHTHTHHLPPSTWCCPYQPQHQSIKHTIYHHQHGAVHASLNTSQSHTHTPSTTINMVLSMPASTPVNHTHTHHLPPSTWCCPCQPQHQSITHTIYHHSHGAVHVSHNTSQSQTPSTTINMVLSMPATTPVNHTHHLPPSTWCCPCQPQHQSITHTIYHHQHGAVHASLNTSQSHTPSTTINMVLSMSATTPVNHTHHLPPSTWCCPCQPQHQSITHTIYHHQHGAVHASHNTSQSHTPSTTINMVLSMPATTPVNHTHHLPPSTWCCPCQPQHQSITHTIYHHSHGAVHVSHNTSQSHTPSTTINMVLSMPATTPVNHTHHLPPSTWCCPCQPQHQSITHTIYHHQHGAVHASHNTSQSHTPSTTIHMVLSMSATTPVNHTHHLPPFTWC